MKTKSRLLFCVGLFSIFFIGCEKEEDPETPEIPPYESMSIDFSKFKVNEEAVSVKSVNLATTENWTLSKNTVGFWSLITGATLVVPIASFYASFSQDPEYLGDNKWKWSYEVSGFTATINAELTAEVANDSVKWEMYIEKEGVNGFPQFKWFEGTSSLSGTGGNWVLYHSYDFQEKVLLIEWEKASDSIAEITYTYIREADNSGNDNPYYGSYITYGLQDSDYDAFYEVYYYNIWTQAMVDIDIEWNTSEYYGHVKAEYYYSDTEWHCWDSLGYDMDCN